MVIDTSAMLACLFDEPERALFDQVIADATMRSISVFGVIEASFVVLTRKGDAGLAELRTFLDRADVERVAINGDQAELAVEAFRRFGKGRHPAGLNIGDCLAYALAKSSGKALLFKGDDFSKTDIASALDPGQR